MTKKKTKKEIQQELEERKDEKYPFKYSIIHCTYKVIHSSIREREDAFQIIKYNWGEGSKAHENIIGAYLTQRVFDDEASDDLYNYRDHIANKLKQPFMVRVFEKRLPL